MKPKDINPLVYAVVFVAIIALVVWITDRSTPKAPAYTPPLPVSTAELDTALYLQGQLFDYIVMVENGVISRDVMDQLARPLKSRIDSLIGTLDPSQRAVFDSVSQLNANSILYRIHIK